MTDVDNELQDRLIQAEADHPGRDAKPVLYGGRTLIALKPTPGQVAAMARLGKSGRMDDLQRIANLLDVLEILLADPDDRAWLANGMLGGELDFGEADDDDTRPASALGLLRAITEAHSDAENRQERRAAKKATRKTTR